MLRRIRCAQAEIVACVRRVTGAAVTHTVERFPTTTPGLVALNAWLQAQGATHAVLEATGVYWKPVWHVLEGTVDLLLAHPASVKAMPARKRHWSRSPKARRRSPNGQWTSTARST